MALVGSLFYLFPFTKREREMFILPVFYLNIIALPVVCVTDTRFYQGQGSILAQFGRKAELEEFG